MEIAEAYRKAWADPDRRPIYDWARENIYLPSATYTLSGEFQVDTSRWLIDIFDALQDDLTEFVTVIAPPRTGKSMIPDIWIPSVVVRDPGTVQWLLQSGDVVKDYAESRIQPVLRSCPGIEAIWPDDRHKASRLRISFKNGCHLYISGPAIAKLQTKGVRYQVRDETWLWKSGRLKEADARLKDWLKIGAAKALTIGQASWKDDETCAMFQDGDQCERFVKCLHCGELQWPKFRDFRPDGTPWGVRWDVPKRERNDHRALSQLLGVILPTVRFECFHCRQSMEDSERTRAEWNRNGEYVAQNPNPKPRRRSFRASGTLFRNWKSMATEFIGAMDAYAIGVIEPLEAFVQKEIPDFFSDAVLFNADPIRKESYNVEELKKKKADGEDARFLMVDRQDQGVMYAVVRSCSKTKGSKRLWRGRLYSEDEVKVKEQEFSVKPSQVLIDGRWDTRVVYAMCIRNGWTCMMGDQAKFFLHPIKRDGRVIGYVRRSYSQPGQGDPEMGRKTHERTRREGARYANFIRFSSDAMNERLQRLLDGRGLPFINPANIDDPEEEEVYRRHLRAEYRRKKSNPTTGAAKIEWVCPSKENHYRDCEKIGVAGQTILNILPDEVEQPVTEEAEKPESEE